MSVIARNDMPQLMPRDPRIRLRLFQVVESLDNRAVESWLFRTFTQAVAVYPDFEWTFFCVLPQSGAFDDTVRELGAEVIHSRYEVGDKIRFMAGLREVMKRGNYDVLHCHHDIMSAAYLLASIGLPFKKRIVHLHNTSMSLPTPSRVKSELAHEPMRQICLRMADQIVGISKEALESLIGRRARDPLRHTVVHYGVDMEKFARPVDPLEFRLELGLGPSDKVMLFVGRIIDYKNPLFVLEVLEELITLDPSVAVVFAGAGKWEAELAAMVKQKQLETRVRLLGFREDVPNLMLGSDLLIWPSLEHPKEGLGLGIVEAQTAGLPILMSRSVPDEAIVVPELVQVLPLSAGPKVWAETACQILRTPHLARSEALARMQASSFSLSQGVANLMALYAGPSNNN